MLVLGLILTVVAAGLLSSSSLAQAQDQADRGTPKLASVRGQVEVTDHLATLKIVARTRHTRSLRVPSLQGSDGSGPRVERRKHHKFVILANTWVSQKNRVDRFCWDLRFRLKSRAGDKVTVSRRVCFRSKG